MEKLVTSKQKITIGFIILCIIIALFSHTEIVKPIEELNTPNAIGWDIEGCSGGNVEYSIPINAYQYKGYQKSGVIVLTGTGINLSDTRIDRQRRSNKIFLLGTERANIISEATARYGINYLTNVLYSNPLINDNHIDMVCAGKAKDIMEFQSQAELSPGEYLEGLIENMQYYSFYSNNYNEIDVVTRLKAEGRNLCLPYLAIKEGKLQIDGMALFKKDKMIDKIDIKDAMTLNLLKEDNVRGALAITKNSKESIGFEAESKRKVKCKKDKKTGRYEFEINIGLRGVVTGNTLYKDLLKDPKVLDEFRKDMDKEVETRCQGFVEKMQKEYKTDLLELGRVGAAKYGRLKEKDWDEIVSNSDIKVHAEVKVILLNRGEY